MVKKKADRALVIQLEAMLKKFEHVLTKVGDDTASKRYQLFGEEGGPILGHLQYWPMLTHKTKLKVYDDGGGPPIGYVVLNPRQQPKPSENQRAP